MSETKDPAIKLFGKTIKLPENSLAKVAGGDASEDRRSSSHSVPGNSNEGRSGAEQEVEKLSSGGRTHGSTAEDGAEDGSESMMSENQQDPQLSAVPKESSEADPAKDSKGEDGQEEKSSPEDKKKPDKILPCPRCNSMDTKFCYFNNYNVNQPRHYCRKCQRYWTAGGSMRNVAVGAGRRKNKNSACRNPEMAYHPQADAPNGLYHPAQNHTGAVLTFGTDSPLCESMATVLNIADRKMQGGFQGAVDVKLATGNGDISSAPKEGAGNMIPTQVLPLQIPSQMIPYPGAPWPFPWVPVPVPATFCPPGFQIGFYPTPTQAMPMPYWGCHMPGGWGVPLISPPYTPTSGPNSPLGKHPRDDKTEEPRKERVIESDPEKCLWVPKTLRIDDPKEAAKSSIWETLGIKDNPVDSPGASLFKAAFPSKAGGDKTHATEAESVLQANPAAMSRSITFHERS